MPPPNMNFSADAMNILLFLVTCGIKFMVVRQGRDRALKDAMKDLKEANGRVAELEEMAGAKERRWSAHFDQTNVKVEKINEEYGQAKSCMVDFCCHCCSVYSFVTRAEEMLKKVKELQDESRDLDVVNWLRIPPVIDDETHNLHSMVGMEQHMKEVSSFLGEDGAGTMVIYGMGGVGKTALLRSINKRLFKGSLLGAEEPKFDLVIRFGEDVVSDVDKVQRVVFERLKLRRPSEMVDSEEADRKKRATTIRKLLGGKSFLLLFDKIWKPPDLDAIGIPCLQYNHGIEEATAPPRPGGSKNQLMHGGVKREPPQQNSDGSHQPPGGMIHQPLPTNSNDSYKFPPDRPQHNTNDNCQLPAMPPTRRATTKRIINPARTSRKILNQSKFIKEAASEVTAPSNNVTAGLSTRDVGDDEESPSPNIACQKFARKVIFTTRQGDLFDPDSNLKKLEMRCMEEEHAWELFGKNCPEAAGIRNCRNAPPLVKKAFEISNGLPIYLITIGKALAKLKDNSRDRMHFLNMLGKYHIEGVYHIFGDSYNRLKDEDTQNCCLYCALWPEGHSIKKDKLIESWMGLGLIDESKYPGITEAYGRGNSIIHELREANLLEGGDDEESEVRMHSVIRGLALWVARSKGNDHNRWLVPEVSQENVEGKHFKNWDVPERVSRINNGILCALLPENLPFCPSLLVLELQGCHLLQTISLAALQRINKLTYLNLSGASIESLDIGELVMLQFLNLSHTKIASLPEELGNLESLKYLYLEGTDYLRRIPQGVISRLKNLRVLNLYKSSFSDWQAEDRDSGSEDHSPSPMAPSPGRNKAIWVLKKRFSWPSNPSSSEASQQVEREREVSLAEFSSLNKLVALGITVKTASAVRELTRLPGVKVRSLYINCLNETVTLNLSSAFLGGTGNMTSLEKLSIANCKGLKTLRLKMEEADSNHELPALSTLHLSHLNKLEKIQWDSVVPHLCLRSLNVLNIGNCDELVDVTWVLRLPLLAKLVITSCKKLKQVIMTENENASRSELVTPFPSLKSMTLTNLSSFISICGNEWTFPCITQLHVEKCPKLKTLPSTLKMNAKLCKIEASEEWVNALECSDDFRSWIMELLPNGHRVNPVEHPIDISVRNNEANKSMRGAPQQAGAEQDHRHIAKTSSSDTLDASPDHVNKEIIGSFEVELAHDLTKPSLGYCIAA